MPNPYPRELRERAVRAYESGEGTYVEVAQRFEVSKGSLEQWVRRARETGSLEPLPKGGGWYSPVDMKLLHQVVRESAESTLQELTTAYNRRAPKDARVHRSSVFRALRRAGFVCKKNARGRRSMSARKSKPSAGPSAGGRRR